MTKNDATETQRYDEKAFKKLPQVSQMDLQAQAYHYAGEYRKSVEAGAQRIKEAGQALADHRVMCNLIDSVATSLETRAFFNGQQKGLIEALDQAVSDFNFADRMTASWHKTYETYTAWLG